VGAGALGSYFGGLLGLNPNAGDAMGPIGIAHFEDASTPGTTRIVSNRISRW